MFVTSMHAQVGVQHERHTCLKNRLMSSVGQCMSWIICARSIILCAVPSITNYSKEIGEGLKQLKK